MIELLGTPANVIKTIEQTDVLYTSGGREKGIDGLLKQLAIRGIGPKFILQNKELLFGQESAHLKTIANTSKQAQQTLKI